MNKNKNPAFTIVELLVVIVVIGILAAISIVSFSGVQNKAIIVGLKSDLTSDAKLLKMYNVEHGYYPSALDVSNCPSAPDIDTRYCLKSSPNTFLTYNGGNQAFKLRATYGTSGIFYEITENTIATVVADGWKQVAAGESHTCAISNYDKLYCWGSNAYGQLGDNSTTNRLVPTAIDMTGVLSGKTIKAVDAGLGNTCVIASDDQAYCWGYNSQGQIGDNTSGTNRLVPTAVYNSGTLSGKTIKSISVGTMHTCVIASDNQAYCWGYNWYGQIGDNTSSNNKLVPTAVYTSGILSGKTVKQISAGGDATCAIPSDNLVYCWGSNSSYQIGDTTNTNRSVPTAVYNTAGVLNGKTIKSVSSDYKHGCVIASDDKAYCWGYGVSGQLGNNASANSSIPVTVSTAIALSGKTVLSIAADGENTCVIASDNQVYCWGYGGYGQIGDNTSGTNRLIPTAVYTADVFNGKTVKSIEIGYNHACAIASDDQIYCWGRNNVGQIGDNTSGTNRLVPTAITNPF